ncbi:MAG: hypothetical protein COS39_10870 [Hydrogenophilales bacterium CG03_land_8_20_14_0_80_62_28]|nr:hypothetical protein [Betaproteobacteria bacterium]OIO79204.1 MAG: hypothetical protein AUJ86_02955 [Hydrogenophilaceae bacterium CG1_02_62_390]PIV21495.1 MAG: hypothetical protein COS39_10870 [Hydrogenophilales bacterium CG03_land_8_20_14_0_80_62_28]PIW38749.1 MAG: hypothetical protein COW23_04975 [Hydrogenophilales bacterium CG15_BIG_FIL_POST_REV_8_21_14_020_62_31]PIW71782.1 MAG: hypothetical protein COW07_06430 [Hydrogenophilales bacterium CG12_big_fil_rev_8_21_14_0_65_61_21]PIY98330.1 M
MAASPSIYSGLIPRSSAARSYRSLPEAENCLKPGVTLVGLNAIASECSDNDAAKRINEARAKLFQLINKTQLRAA